MTYTRKSIILLLKKIEGLWGVLKKYLDSLILASQDKVRESIWGHVYGTFFLYNMKESWYDEES